eukprot:3912904-Pyramimonas_sp.AAC.1
MGEGEGGGWSTRKSSRKRARSRKHVAEPDEGGPRRPGRAGGLLKRAPCINREGVSSDIAIPK